MSKEINLETFRKIFQSDEVGKELIDLSSWARGVKQERHISNILAKYLDKKDYNFKMEYSKIVEKKKYIYDLRIEDILVEVKFSFEEDINFQIEKEIYGTQERPVQNDFLNQYLIWIDQREEENKIRKEKKKKPKGWGRNFTALAIIDIFKKKCDYFILIVQSRDIRKIPPKDLENIVASERCISYNREYDADGGYNVRKNLSIIEKLLESINIERPYNSAHIEIEATNRFPCKYHIYILEFKP
jgi:hypothetical protein